MFVRSGWLDTLQDENIWAAQGPIGISEPCKRPIVTSSVFLFSPCLSSISLFLSVSHRILASRRVCVSLKICLSHKTSTRPRTEGFIFLSGTQTGLSLKLFACQCQGSSHIEWGFSLTWARWTDHNRTLLERYVEHQMPSLTDSLVNLLNTQTSYWHAIHLCRSNE